MKQNNAEVLPAGQFNEEMRFEFGVRKSVVARFDGGEITSDAGFLLLRAADDKAGLCRALSGALRDRRQPGKVQHSQYSMIQERTYGIAAGYPDANDHKYLGRDAGLKTACGRLPHSGADLASQPTLSRFENNMGRTDLMRMAFALGERVVAQLPDDTREVVLDVDASDDPCHGQQVLQFFNGYYDCHCFLPLFLHVEVNGGRQWLLAPLLRPGNAKATLGLRFMLKHAVRLLRARFPKIHITVRGDGAFGNDTVLRVLDALKVEFSLGLAGNPRLEKLSWQVEIEAQLMHLLGDRDVRKFDDFRYAAGTWDKPRRVVVKAEMLDNKLNVRYIVTSDAEASTTKPEAAYRFYCQRGDQENRIKELKLDLDSGRTSCHEFFANQFRLLLHGAACVLMSVLQEAAAGTQWARAQAGTLRLRLLKVAARVVESCRNVWFHLSSSFPDQAAWFHLHAQLSGAPPGEAT